MAILYLTEQGSILRKTGDRILVTKDEETLLDVPCAKIDQVLIFGSVQVTVQALSELLEHGIELALLTRHGRLKGQLTPIKSKNILLRVAQYDRSRDAAFAISTATEIVKGKISNGIEVLRRFSYNHPERGIQEIADRIEGRLAGVGAATSLEELNGLEGVAAREYFSGFGRMLLGDLPFAGRKRRPATDPVNALLSFGYTLIANEIHSLLDAIGFDPYLGFFHQIDYGRPSLALDLMEEFRHPLVDRFTVTLVNKGILKSEDFSPEPASGAMYLKPEAMKLYFRHFEHFLLEETLPAADGKSVSFRRCFQLQAQAMAQSLQKGTPYSPFRYGG